MKYLELAKVYEKLENTSKRLEKTKIVSELLKKTSSEELETQILLIQGTIFRSGDERKIGVASKLILKSINISTGINSGKIEEEWKKTGDLGIVAENLVKKKKQSTLFSQDLSIKKVFENIKSLASLEGSGSVDKKVKIISELLTSAKPIEAKYIVRTVLEDLRIGVGDGSLRDSIVWAYFSERLELKYNSEKNEISLNEEQRKEYNLLVNSVQEALDISNDFSLVAKTAKEEGIAGLKKIELKTGLPIKVMLYQKANNIEDAFERVGTPAAIEYKFDGFRLQIHKSKENIKLFTRRLEEVTAQFPDVIKTIKQNIKAESFILDAEVIGIDKKTKKWLPFQEISQRIKRKYDIEKLSKSVPVMINLFDAVIVDNVPLLKKPFKKRRETLEKITKITPEKIQLANQIITDDLKKAENFYNESLDKGNEGIMLKALDKPYKPGSRVGYGVKVKPIMETLDLVIIGAEWGEGKRANWLSSFTLACIDEDNNFLEIGKVGTGIKEKDEEGVSFQKLTNMLNPLIISPDNQLKNISVKPKIVLEVSFEEIQKSSNYSSGYALRFPRVVRLREERNEEDISSLEIIEELYYQQKKR